MDNAEENDGGDSCPTEPTFGPGLVLAGRDDPNLESWSQRSDDRLQRFSICNHNVFHIDWSIISLLLYRSSSSCIAFQQVWHTYTQPELTPVVARR